MSSNVGANSPQAATNVCVVYAPPRDQKLKNAVISDDIEMWNTLMPS